MARATSRLGHKSRRKNSVRTLRYGPRTRLVRGIYFRVEWRLLSLLCTFKYFRNTRGFENWGISFSRGLLPGASIFHSDRLNQPCAVPALMGVFQGVI